ncbi:hypothetical protein QL285_027887 [Trifolium repens]|nr:hypothetical protein QL285_027887 [Trifolium repens]
MDVARVKLRTVRREMIDTVLQLKVQGETFDVWVVEEHCGCGEERSYVEEDSHRNLERSNSNSGGEHGWRGDDRDLFDDGRSDSDGSDSCKSLLGLQEGGKKQTEVMAGDKGGTSNIDPQSQNFMKGNVGEILSDVPIADGYVEVVGKDTLLIPSYEDGVGVSEIRGQVVGPVFVSPPNSNFETLVNDTLASHVMESVPLEVIHPVGPIGPSGSHWNPFVEMMDRETRALESNGVPVLHDEEEGVQLIQAGSLAVVEVEKVLDNGVVRLSQLSESSVDSSQELGTHTKTRNSKKGLHNPVRPIPPMIGVPKFRQLELTLKAAGRRQKENGKGSSSSDDCSLEVAMVPPLPAPTLEPLVSVNPLPQLDTEMRTVSNLVAVTPVPNSGLNLLLDNGGGFILEPTMEEADIGISKEDEATLLIGIQKEVGFNFEVGDVELQSKLVELDNFDREKNVELVQERGYQ